MSTKQNETKNVTITATIKQKKESNYTIVLCHPLYFTILGLIIIFFHLLYSHNILYCPFSHTLIRQRTAFSSISMHLISLNYLLDVFQRSVYTFIGMNLF